MREDLVRADEDGYIQLVHRGEAQWCGPVVDESPTATLEELADFCDQLAESGNAHDFVGTHRLLAVLLHRYAGREKATAILREVAERHGLHGMSGVLGAEDSFSDFGIQGCWHEWSLPEDPHA
jgi:hypothetical protein